MRPPPALPSDAPEMELNEIHESDTLRIAMRTIILGLLAAAVILPVWAHHSFGAEYDAAKPITLTV